MLCLTSNRILEVFIFKKKKKCFIEGNMTCFKIIHLTGSISEASKAKFIFPPASRDNGVLTVLWYDKANRGFVSSATISDTHYYENKQYRI